MVKNTTEDVAVEKPPEEMPAWFSGFSSRLSRIEELQVTDSGRLGALEDSVLKLQNSVANVQDSVEKIDRRIESIEAELPRVRDRLSMVETQSWASVVGAQRPEPPHLAPTGTGLIDPVSRWRREHPFRR